MKLNVVVFLLVVGFSTISSAEDFYQLLGITKSATQRDIRRAFKRLALEKHPDKRSVSSFFFVKRNENSTF